MTLLKLLKTFYRNEGKGISTEDHTRWEIAQDIADIIEDTNNWTPVMKVFSGSEVDDAHYLRSNWTPIVIDQAVNGLHQALLDGVDRSGESSEEMLNLNISLQEYLLTRKG